jgi:hypothetical protein
VLFQPFARGISDDAVLAIVAARALFECSERTTRMRGIGNPKSRRHNQSIHNECD